MKHDTYETVEKGHGRIEVRRYWVTPDLSGIERPERWRGLRTIGLAEAERLIGDQVSVEQRVFICSFDRGVEVFGRAVRDHWGIENSLH